LLWCLGDGGRRALAAIAEVELVQLRLGQIKEAVPAWQRDVREALDELGVDARRFEERLPLRAVVRQKAVDTLLAIDLARLAERSALSHALVLAGDGDFAPAVQVARDAGVTGDGAGADALQRRAHTACARRPHDRDPGRGASATSQAT
jgi:uncharacterized LabA/DUF88 family protein